MTLGERASGRDNNFNLVRLMAAGLVLVSHSWPLTGTPGEPLEKIADFSLGHLGVDIFFVVSGFLVTGSLLDRPMGSFLRARALRIFPALAANSFGTALVIGPLVTALPWGATSRPGTRGAMRSRTRSRGRWACAGGSLACSSAIGAAPR
jgi:peptidoglycan/LPS O-acetylase OafA/YrhL